MKARNSDKRSRVAICLTVSVIVCLISASSPALILVRRGNDPVENMGWPLGSEKVANLSSRLGYWEGPPFGGGRYQFLYRCQNTGEFNKALVVFASIRAPKLILVVHDGPEHSFWLEEADSRARNETTRVDWTFTVWKPASWHSLYSNPKSLFSSGQPRFRQPVPAPQIDVYIGGGGSIVWKEVKVPRNVSVIDKRAESAPVKPLGGGLVRGSVYDMATGQPVSGAEIILVKRRGRRDWEEVGRGKTDHLGSGEVHKVPAGRYEIQVQAKGYASRKQSSWHNKGNSYHEFIVELMRQVSIKGLVTDSDGKPISGVKVSARNTLGIDGLGYPCVDAVPATTNEQGHFEIGGLPEGFTHIRCQASSLHQVTSIFELYDVPSDDIRIAMAGTGTVRGKVVFPNVEVPRDRVHVHIQPPGPLRRGQWGGAMRCKEDGSFEFKKVPPGEYLISTSPLFDTEGDHPNTETVTVKVGKTAVVELIHSRAH